MPDDRILPGTPGDVADGNVPVDVIGIREVTDVLPRTHVAVFAVTHVGALHPVHGNVAEHHHVGLAVRTHVVSAQHIPFGGFSQPLPLPRVRAVQPEAELIVAAGVLEKHIAHSVPVDVRLRRNSRNRRLRSISAHGEAQQTVEEVELITDARNRQRLTDRERAVILIGGVLHRDASRKEFRTLGQTVSPFRLCR